MTIRKKLILIQCLLLSLLFIGVGLVTYFYAFPQVRALEKKQFMTDISRADRLLTQELSQLSIIAADWAMWDDTYEYMAKKSAGYEQSNLVGGTLETLNTDFLVMVDLNRQVIWRQFSKQMEHLLPLNQTVLPMLQLGQWDKAHPLLNMMQGDKRGVLLSEFGPVLVSGQFIRTSEGKGEPRGYLYFGRLMTDAYVKKLSHQLEVDLSISVTRQSLWPTFEERPKVSFLSNEQVLAQMQRHFVNTDEQYLALNIIQSRSYYQEFIMVARYSLLVIIVIGLFSCVVTYFILKTVLVTPILVLQRQANQFARHNTNAIKPLLRNDEIGKLSVCLVRMASELNDSWWQLEQERNEYMDASYTDALTGLKNRRFLDYFLANESIWYPAKNWSFLMLDIDRFKKVNDQYGHDIGDIVLQQLSVLLSDLSRDSDVVFRTGGEEFVIVCQQAGEQQSEAVCERIRTNVEKFPFGSKESPFHVTCSIGFFSLHVNQALTTDEWSSFLKLADLSLYAAKNSGRNTWVGLRALHTDVSSQMVDLPGDVLLVQRFIEQHRFKLISSLANVSDVRWQ